MQVNRWLRRLILFSAMLPAILPGVLATTATVFLPVVAMAADTPVDIAAFSAPGEALKAGEQFENSRRWVEAIELYELAVKRWQDDPDLTYALRRTRIHFGIDRRYADLSFESQMLPKGRGEALDLMEDILGRVQLDYVDRVSPTKFVAHGTESLYMALGNDRFLKRNLQTVDPIAIDQVRQLLIKEYWNRPVSSRGEARSIVSGICDRVGRQIGLSSSAIVLEYIFGGCNALDEYSNLLTPDRYGELVGGIQGELVGIGIEMKAEKGRGMHLVNVLLESPAEDGGLLPGDYIVAIDGQDCRNASTDEAAALLKGTGGSRVSLQWESPSGKLTTGEFVRRRVHIRSITRAVMLNQTAGIGYIRMDGFQNTTAEELDDALRKLEGEGMRALIWDLRDNPGGLLETAAAVIDRFIDRGILVTTKGRSPDQNQVFQAHAYNTRSYPLVLLVNENSASASEIVAGAIHDHRRGVIVGRRTYGKWSVQSIITLPGEATALKLTTAKFFSPNDQNYSGEGLAPDVDVPLPKDLQRMYFRGRTADELLLDSDIAKGLEVLESRLSRK